MCQGFGYFFGTGLFWDPDGDDTHLVTHKYAQGGATHYAVGLLVDGAGNDTWRNDDDDECTGIGYDASVAWHLDLGDGDDTYTMENVSQYTVGVTRFAALGVLVNEGGDDIYDLAGDPSFSLGRAEEQAGMRAGYLGFDVPAVAMFLDLGGADTYPTRGDVGNDRVWIQDEPLGDDWTAGVDFGYGLDGEDTWTR